MVDLKLEAVVLEDAPQLAELRVQAMRPGLERVGRFEPERAKQRLLADFVAEYTRHIVVDGLRAGFVVLRPKADDLLLDHFYLHPDFQHCGIGAAALAMLLDEADVLGKTMHVGALRDSDANRFYVRHGFILREAAEFDNYYVRYPQVKKLRQS